MNTSQNRITDTASAFWENRSQRERRQISVALALAAAALVYTILFDPAIAGRKQLTKNLPVLRQQAAQMQALSQEAATLAHAVAQPTVSISKESLEAGLSRRGLKAQSILLTGDLAKVQFGSASFASMLDWLDELQKTARMSVVDANISALAQTDMVSATLTLRQQSEQKGE